MRRNRAIYTLIAIAIGIAIGAFVFRGEREKPDTPDLPPIAIESE